MGNITKNGGNAMLQDVKIEGVKAAPAAVGVVLYELTLNEAVAIATLFYVIMQTGYLAWKWWREFIDYRRNRKGGK